jgi:hypothetical protein
VEIFDAHELRRLPGLLVKDCCFHAHAYDCMALVEAVDVSIGRLLGLAALPRALQLPFVNTIRPLARLGLVGEDRLACILVAHSIGVAGLHEPKAMAAPAWVALAALLIGEGLELLALVA